MRVFAFSDLHVDHAANLDCVRSLARRDYRDDTLLLAGDVSDDLGLLDTAFGLLRERFAQVFFVPGNHELWDRRGSHAHALDRFEAVRRLAVRNGVRTDPAPLAERGTALAWVVPLFSWYRGPDEGATSLFLPKNGERRARVRWADDHFVHWPADMAHGPADHFLALNEPRIRAYPAPVISFSHFLPRRELMFSLAREGAGNARRDPHPQFNFSRVAGCGGLDRQIRRLGSWLHVYGHQHRNRERVIDGVRYVSHCLGYPRERDGGYLRPDALAPRCVWTSPG